MAYLDATDWNDIQMLEATNDKRFSELGLVDAVADSTPFVDYVSPSAKEQLQKASALRAVQVPVLKDQVVTVVQTPGFNFIPSNLPESDQYSFTAVDVFTGFRHYPAQFANNVMDEQWTKQQVMKNVAYAAGNVIEGLLATTLEARKSQTLGFTTQVSQGNGTFTFNAGTDTLEVNKAAQKETMFANLETLMKANELPGGYRLVTNRAGTAVQKSEALKYGANNQQNLQALGFLGLDRMYESGNVSAGSDIFNGWYFRDGSIGMFENFPYDFANGTVTEDGKRWSISDVQIPWTRLRANIYVNNEAVEATSLVGAGTDTNLIMTTFSEMALWFRFYQVYRYNGDIANRANDIVKIKGLTT